MKVVLAHGVFDILHYGHLVYLTEAKKHGNVLVVSVTADEYVNKGPERPVFTLRKRMEMLKALRMVDRVMASHAMTPENVIRQVRPDVYAKGIEYKGRLPEQAMLEAMGCKVIFTEGDVHSSTALIAYV